MATVVLTATSKPADFPAGTVGGAWRFSISGIGEQDVSGLSATFVDVPSGAYSATVQRLDDAGEPLGSPASASFTVVPGAVTIEIADGLTVDVA